MPSIWSISHLAHALTIVLLTEGSDRDVSDWCLEHDQWMGAIVAERGNSFTAGTQVGIVTDCTLVASAADVLLVRFDSTKGTIAKDAKVDFFLPLEIRKLFEHSGKAVTRMDFICAEDTSRAEVPVRAAQTLVADTKDMLR